jgi:hypothetical protein
LLLAMKYSTGTAIRLMTSDASSPAMGQQRPIVIQTMVPSIDGRNPFASEIEEYIARLRELKNAGTQISLVSAQSKPAP